jgi:hypothetical protein
MKICPNCNANVMIDAVSCPVCRYSFVEDSTEPLQIGKVSLAPRLPQDQTLTTNAWTTGRFLSLLGGIFIIIGSFLPWAKVVSGPFGVVTFNGMDGDGIILAIAGAIILLLALTKKTRLGMSYSLLVGVVGIIAVIISFIDISNLRSLVAGADFADLIIQTGEGLYLCVLGSFMAAVGGFITAPAEG